jgi:hypothetical protein
MKQKLYAILPGTEKWALSSRVPILEIEEHKVNNGPPSYALKFPGYPSLPCESRQDAETGFAMIAEALRHTIKVPVEVQGD